MTNVARPGLWKLLIGVVAGWTIAQAPFVAFVALKYRLSLRDLAIPCTLLMASSLVSGAALYWAGNSQAELPGVRMAVATFAMLFSLGISILISAVLLKIETAGRAATV